MLLFVQTHHMLFLKMTSPLLLTALSVPWFFMISKQSISLSIIEHSAFSPLSIFTIGIDHVFKVLLLFFLFVCLSLETLVGIMEFY